MRIPVRIHYIYLYVFCLSRFDSQNKVQNCPPSLRWLRICRAHWHQAWYGPFENTETQSEQFPMNPGCTPGRVGYSHCPDKATDFTFDLWSSGTFGFEFPEKLKTLAVPKYNSIQLYNYKRFAPRYPKSGEQNQEDRNCALLTMASRNTKSRFSILNTHRPQWDKNTQIYAELTENAWWRRKIP